MPAWGQAFILRGAEEGEPPRRPQPPEAGRLWPLVSTDLGSAWF
jgi:hypothetical protein